MALDLRFIETTQSLSEVLFKETVFWRYLRRKSRKNRDKNQTRRKCAETKSRVVCFLSSLSCLSFVSLPPSRFFTTATTHKILLHIIIIIITSNNLLKSRTFNNKQSTRGLHQSVLSTLSLWHLLLENSHRPPRLRQATIERTFEDRCLCPASWWWIYRAILPPQLKVDVIPHEIWLQLSIKQFK